MKSSTIRCAVLLICMALAANAKVKLPTFFSDNMVLQQKTKAAIWGWADAKEKVTVNGSWGATATTVADATGKWRLKIPTPAAGGPFTITINSIELKNVLIGEVWLCSGQSNMQFTVWGCRNSKAEIAAAKYPMIRHFGTPRVPQNRPVDDVKGNWQVCSPQTVGGFTAVGYFFARHLHKQLGVPIGLINSSWGGTLIEPWTPPAGFAQVPSLKEFNARVQLADPASPAHKKQLKAYIAELEAWLAQARQNAADGAGFTAPPTCPKGLLPIMEQTDGRKHQQPTALFNGMIAPFVGYGMRGAIWYQGESNHRDGMLYVDKKRALVGGWRKLWGIGDFPFYWVQIAPFQYGNEDPTILAKFWEAQAAALAIPNTGMAVIHDIGNLRNIHPKNKQDAGKRLALIALARDYGKDVVYSGPTFKSMKIEGAKIRITFDHVGGGLVSRDGKPLSWFEIIGEDTDFEKADAVIDGNTVVVSSPKVKKACAVRFGWHKLAEPNLMNKEGLPARQFRAGTVPKRDWMALKVPEAKDYQLLYELDLAKLGPNIRYDINNAGKITGTPSRIAYYIELQKGGGKSQFAYVSMDAFTTDLTKMGIPTVATGAKFQQPVKNLTIVSNAGIKTGTGIAGNIEFWPHNYGPQNVANVKGASNSIYDFGDTPSEPANGYGSMQVHNTSARQTVFAINKWKSGPTADIGIGNCLGKARDWTFTGSGTTYTAKRLRVLVKTK